MGINKYPTEIKGTKDKGLTKLEELAALAPKEIPAWFDYFLEEPPMPKPPEGADRLPWNLQDLGRSWLQNPEVEINLNVMDKNDRAPFQSFCDEWREYFALRELAQQNFQMARYLLWRVTYASMILHTLNVRTSLS